MKISVSSYSFDQYLRSDRMTQADTVKAAAELGFCGIEFTDLAPTGENTLETRKEYAMLLRDKAKECGIEIVAYTIGASLFDPSEEKRAAEVERVCAEADVAALLGARILRHDVTWGLDFGGRRYSFDAQLPYIADSARRITEYAERLGIRTCTENHGYIAQDSDRVERLYNAVGHENYGLLCDVGNFACADEDSAAAVSRVAPYVFHVHAKDFYISDFGEPAREGSFPSRGCRMLAGAAVGEGDIPVARCMAILKRAGYDGFVSIEYEGAEDCISALSRGLDNLGKMV